MRIIENWALRLFRASWISGSHSEVSVDGKWWIQVAVWVLSNLLERAGSRFTHPGQDRLHSCNSTVVPLCPRPSNGLAERYQDPLGNIKLRQREDLGEL